MSKQCPIQAKIFISKLLEKVGIYDLNKFFHINKMRVKLYVMEM